MTFSDLAKTLTSALDKEAKKADGIFFTPGESINRCVNVLQTEIHGGGSKATKKKTRVPKATKSSKTTKAKSSREQEQSQAFNLDDLNILEPSCGAGDFIGAMRTLFPSAKITGIELNKEVFDGVAEDETFTNDEKLTLLNEDFLAWDADNMEKYDVIVGNPPFFVMKKKDVPVGYDEYYSGRPNIFLLFIAKCLRHLKKNGYLSIVLPRSFLNSQYYDKMRRHIFATHTIIDIEDCSQDKYLDTQQDTVLFTLRNAYDSKSADINKNYSLRLGDCLSFNTKEVVSEIKSLLDGSTTLKDSGFTVNVGKVVWNEKKALLTSNPAKTRLIYATDIGKDGLQMKTYKSATKKNYIDMDGITDVMLAVNRGYGVGSYEFKSCIVAIDKPYLLENHVIGISYEASTPDDSKTREELIDMFTQIQEGFMNEKTKRFIELYFGNHAITTKELASVVPMFF
jgi:tRNA1(Val) A37 N6-methylase TrmN6